MENMDEHAAAIKEMNIKLFNIDPEKHDSLAKFTHLQKDKENILAALKTEIAGSGKPSQVHNMLASKHNDHVYDVLDKHMNISAPLGMFCTCEDHEACYLSEALITEADLKPMQEVQTSGALQVEHEGTSLETPVEILEEKEHAMSEMFEFAKLGSRS